MPIKKTALKCLGISVVVVVAALLLIIGCSGSHSSPTIAPITTPAAGHVVYVANSNHGGLQGSISVFVVGSTASLTPVPGSPLPAGINTSALATDAAHKFLYAANVDGLSAYLINTDGSLQPITGSPFDSSESLRSVAVTPAASFVYAANTVTGTVSGFRIGAGGALGSAVPNSPVQTATPTGTSNIPTAVRIDPSGHFLYTANGLNGIFVFTINATDGSLAFVDNVKPNGISQPVDIAITPDSRFAFAPNAASSGGVDAYSIASSNGDLTLIAGSPFATNGNEPLGAAVDPTGKLLFAVNFISNSVSAFAIDSSGGLTPVGAPASTDSNPNSVAVDPSGSLLYVANLGAGTVNIFKVSANGTLQPASTTATGQVRLFSVIVTN